MRIVVSTPHVLDKLNQATRPYNFMFYPLIDTAAGYPAGVDPKRFRLITAFTKKRERWIQGDFMNVCDGKRYRLGLIQTRKLNKVIPQTHGYVLRSYLRHPESKSLAPDGTPCIGTTRGLLRRASIVAGEKHFVGKETDRRWEQGDDLSLLDFKPMEFKRPTVVADTATRKKIDKHGIRKLERTTGIHHRILQKIRAGKKVRPATLKRLEVGFKRIEASA